MSEDASHAPAELGKHRDPRSFGLLDKVAVAAAVAVDLWLFFVVLDPATRYLDDELSGMPLLLILCGWFPVGGFLLAGAAVALRHQYLRSRGRPWRKLEQDAYGWTGVAWFGFAILMAGKQGRYEAYDPGAVIEHVSVTSAPIADGVAAGVISVFFFLPVLVVGFFLGKLLKVPRPGWPLPWTVASWLGGSAVLGLALALASASAYL